MILSMSLHNLTWPYKAKNIETSPNIVCYRISNRYHIYVLFSVSIFYANDHQFINLSSWQDFIDNYTPIKDIEEVEKNEVII